MSDSERMYTDGLLHDVAYQSDTQYFNAPHRLCFVWWAKLLLLAGSWLDV